jgi:Glycosyltransferase family 87
MAESLETPAPVSRDAPGSGQTGPGETGPDGGYDWAGLSIATVAALSLTLAALFFFAMPFAGHLAGSRDFVSYWATGRQLVDRANPYDRDAVGRLEHAQGLDLRAVLIMRNPPWALVLAWPLGFLPLRVAAVLWSLALLGCLIVSVAMLRRLHGSPPNHIHWLGLAFTPAILCITMGQTSLFALLGLVLFLRYHRQRPFAAGLALWLCALKPHLFLPFAAALALWIVVSRAWKIVAGAAAALALTSAISLVLDPRAGSGQIWSDYIRMMRSPQVENDFIPCLTDALHHWLWPQHMWTQYLPAALACVWAVLYYWRRRAHWNWTSNASPLMLISLLLAPYAWFYDQCLLIPALLHAAYSARSRAPLIALALMILAADLQLCFVKVTSPLWLWTTPAWLAWYLLAEGSRRSDLLTAESATCL